MAEELNNEGQPVEGQTQENQEPQGFDFGSLNDYYKDTLGETPLTEESFKGLLESQSKVGEFEQQIQAKDQELQGAMEYKTKYESFLETYNPEKLTPNKEALAISQLSDQHKGADIGVLSKVRQADLSTIDPIEGLLLADKLQVQSNIPDSVRKEEILKSLGIDDPQDLTEGDKYRIQRAFAKESATLQGIKDFQPDGVNFDFEAESKSYQENLAAQRQALTNHNKEALNILLDGFKETKSTVKDNNGNEVEVSYIVDDKFKQDFLEPALQNLEKQGFKITKENAPQVLSQIEMEYKMNNFDSIVQDSVKQLLSKQAEDFHNKDHNDSPTNKTEAPPTSQKEFPTLRESIRQRLKNR